MTGELIQAHLDRRSRHAPGKVFDYFTSVVRRNGSIVWDEPGPGDYAMVHTFDQAQFFMREAIETNNYCDFHTWVFSPTSFRLIVADLRRLNLLALGEVGFFDSDRGEFHVTLGHNTVAQEFDRIRQIRQIRAELHDIDGVR